MPAPAVVAFAPGRANLIGEHTDYNEGLALPFALTEGVTVRARAREGKHTLVYSHALGERDSFSTRDPERCPGWRAFARGIVAELRRAGRDVRSAEIEIASDLPAGAGLSSSAALAVSLGFALLALAGDQDPDRLELSRLCSRVEHEWVGSQTGLLDQLAVVHGVADEAVLIDFRTLDIERVPLELGAWSLVTVAVKVGRQLAQTGYNERRSECSRAAELLGLRSLREATVDQLERLPEPLRRRARHVVSENERVRQAVRVLASGELDRLGELLDRSHASLRDDYEVSTPGVDEVVQRIRAAGARGARLIGGGFGGTVLALFDPETTHPEGAVARHAGPGARVSLAPG